MNNKLSELVDGELDDDEAGELIKLAGRSDELLAEWKTYHVIGEALRQPVSISSLDISEKVHQQLVSEPTLLVPQLNKIYRASKSKLLGLSAAASIAVLAIGWMVSISVGTGPVQQEMLVAEKIEKRSMDTDNRSVTFLPPSGYSHLPTSIDYNRTDFPFAYRGFSHGGMIYHPHASSANQINEPQMPQTSVRPAPSGN
ncbi:MAG TPA: RseA family anti-sigma factor [Nitrosomonas mobilis]|nr:RseA family anti-sigma factor [Nitrosomonas mobilis]